MTEFLGEIGPAAERNGLVQLALRCTVPGVPDTYQGTEFPDLSLVDPDNRRPVGYAARSAALTNPPRKMRLLIDLLRLREAHPALFDRGSYEPAIVTGDHAEDVLAFERRHGDKCLRCAVTLRSVPDTGSATIAFASGPKIDAGTRLQDAPVWFELV
jgi:(1->4)-alpha-D-glucan 1-alpha-D-glucosylmutase